ncbi:MAG: serine/threonine-protein phosphatase [Weizmannia coagulans]|uniref:SpoIIE family protein phosphatase n=3 Tax=Bacillaceae TaxID=186817 RepID=UPI00077995F7|nr:SpoIIE family protein phosphatase [Heyndrickxia coagulans]MCI1576305.1 serine/threonine-protein phosphatase [Heyndrickxia coagulans]
MSNLELLLIQQALFTDGVMEALDSDSHDGLKILQQLASSTWSPEKAASPLDTVLAKELQEQQPDDMCVVLVQAK